MKTIKLPQIRLDAQPSLNEKTGSGKNPNIEIRNSKQIRMSKFFNLQNKSSVLDDFGHSNV
jgi:hypothetical protein